VDVWPEGGGRFLHQHGHPFGGLAPQRTTSWIIFILDKAGRAASASSQVKVLRRSNSVAAVFEERNVSR